MNAGKLPHELNGLSLVEQQLISRLSPSINIRMLKHGGISSSGHCVTFPQEIDQPAQIFPRLPEEINIIRVRRKGKNDTSKDFNVRRHRVQASLEWLKANNPAFKDIIISQERLDLLPSDAEIPDFPTVEYNSNSKEPTDEGPAPEQVNPGELVDSKPTNSGILLPDKHIRIREKVQEVVSDVLGDTNNDSDVTVSKKGRITIPWPTRGNIPISEFVTKYFFTMSFPCLFPYAKADFFANRKRTCTSMSSWAEHLLWFDDGRFSAHPYFKFIIHNIIMRRRAMENSNFVVQQKLGDNPISLDDLKQKLKEGDNSYAKTILYFGACLRGTNQYWSQRAKELRALVNHQINEGNGLPGIFTTGSCAEYHFKPLKRLLAMYLNATGKECDLEDRTQLFNALQQNTHIVSHYFDLRTKAYFADVMTPVFGVNAFWYRQEFAKSRGMVHWHGLCWNKDRLPHSLIHQALNDGLTSEETAEKLSLWAQSEYGMTASHPAGKNEDGDSKKQFWPPPEGSAPLPPEEKNPLIKLLMDVSETQDSLLEDHILLCNRINLHRCSEYCLRVPKRKNSSSEKICRMEFGTEKNQGKPLRLNPALVKDKNASLRLEMSRDHPAMVQHSKFHTQGWRANGDISLILSKSNPDNPSVEEILAVESYVSGYACKGNEGTGASLDLFNDILNASDESTGQTARSVCSKLLMSTVKRDVSAVEASYELSSLPLYRSSHTFQTFSLSGSRILERNGINATRKTLVDKYVMRSQKDISSLYQYICKSGKVPVLSGFRTQASWPLDEEYSRSMLLLHWPNWRQLKDILPTKDSWTSKLNYFLATNECPNFVKADIERAKQHFNKDKIHGEDAENDDLDDDLDDNKIQPSQCPEWMQVLKPNPLYDIDLCTDFKYDDGGDDYNWRADASKYINLGKNWVQRLQQSSDDLQDDALNLPDVDLKNMNKEQEFAFRLVMHKLLDYKTNNANFEPLRLIVAGTAGSGKSYLIKCLVKSIRTFFNSNKSVQVLCPTGNSANLISGVTLHSFFKLPTGSKIKEMKSPDGNKGEGLQANCEGVEVLLFDERSLIGVTTLGWTEFMCRCGVMKGANSDKSWGGLPVVVFLGDDIQLPPVLDSPVYNCNPKSPASIHGLLVWQEFNEAVCLNTIIRQGNDQQMLRSVLMSARSYSISTDQAKWLQEFQWSDLKDKYGSELLNRMSEKGLFVFSTHKEVWTHNKSKLVSKNISYPIAKLKGIDKGRHRGRNNDKPSSLLDTLYLCIEAKVMLSVNLCVPLGLFNGAVGEVVSIIYSDGKSPKNSLPEVVMVKFPGYTGPPFIPEQPKLVPIVPVDRLLDCNCCRRTQIPLRLGWASTIHRCQGMTIGSGESYEYIVIHPGTTKFESNNPGAMFVALSRAKSAGSVDHDPDFAWHQSIIINEDRLCHVVNTPTTKARSKEVLRIQNMTKKTMKNFCNVWHSKEINDILSQNISTEE